MNYIVTKDNIWIENSYVISDSDEMLLILEELKDAYPNCNVFKIPMKTLIKEWRAHNFLYDLGLFKSHTKDVDLDTNETKLRRFLYSILSMLY